MHRSVARALTVVSLAAVVAATAAPAGARSSRSDHRGGKKAVGEIVSFDASTLALVVDLPGDEDFTGAVDPDVKVKLDHRGWSRKSKADGNPTKGSIADLAAGTPVLRMKVEDDVVTKIRLRPLADEPPALPGDAKSDEADDDADSHEADDDAASDDTDDDSIDLEDSEDAENPDDDDSGDPEDALPPLPATLP